MIVNDVDVRIFDSTLIKVRNPVDKAESPNCRVGTVTGNTGATGGGGKIGGGVGRQ
jgi:hypothetical protein